MIRFPIAKTAVLVFALFALMLALSMTETSVAEAKRRPTPTPTQPPPVPDFLLRYETYSYTDLAYVVKGGLPNCELCVGVWEPRFIDRSGEACFYGSNNFTLTSLNGFEGEVYIGATSIIPRGVTSEIPNRVFIPRDQTVLVPFKQRTGDFPFTLTDIDSYFQLLDPSANHSKNEIAQCHQE